MVSDSADPHTVITVLNEHHPIQALYPYIVAWPESETVISLMHSKYFNSNKPNVNWFNYCILVHKSDSPRDAVASMSREGAFKTHFGRSTLLLVVNEARNTHWCKAEVLDTLERYATYAFVIEGSDMTCGALPT